MPLRADILIKRESGFATGVDIWCCLFLIDINLMHDRPSYLCCPDALGMVGDPLSGNGCGSPDHV